MIEKEDILFTISILKSMKDHKKIAFFESEDGIDFVKSLQEYSLMVDRYDSNKEAVNSLVKALGSVELSKGTITIGEVCDYIPTELAIPQDRTAEMKSFPDKRLNSDHVLRAIGGRVLDPQIHWTRQSELCHLFSASPKSVEAALFSHVGEGRLAFEKLDKEMIFARIN